MGRAPLSELHFIQITGKLLFKTEPLLLAKTLGLLSPDSYPEGPVSFSPNYPGRCRASTEALQPGHPVLHTHAHLGLVLGEKEGKLCRGAALQTSMGDETKVTRGLYSRLPPVVGGRDGQGLEVRLCCHQPDDSVARHRATIHGGLSGREHTCLHVRWCAWEGAASVTPVQSPRSPQWHTAASLSVVRSSCMVGDPDG